MTQAELAQLKALFSNVNLRLKYDKSMTTGETVHQDNRDLIKAFEIEFDLEFGLELCDDMLVDIEEWEKKIRRIQIGASKLKNGPSELSEAQHQ